MTLFGIEITAPFHLRTKSRSWKKPASTDRTAITLLDVPDGCQAVVKGFLHGMPAQRHAQLRAYGLAPGCPVIVVQHTPVTVIRIEHLELALEHGLAREIQVALVE